MLKKLLLLSFIFGVNLLGFSQSNPSPFNLSEGDYSFTEWSEDSEAGTYPTAMIFRTASGNAPNLGTNPIGDWLCDYNIPDRARINGLNEDGFSFIITGNTQDTGARCVDDPESTITSEYPFEAILALNTLGRQNIEVSYTNSILVRNFRNYALRLQYRLGSTGAWINFEDIEASEYVVDAEEFPVNVDETFSVILPLDANNQPLVQLRWVYYQLPDSPGGARPQIRVDDILVTSEPFTGQLESVFYLKPTGAVNILSNWGTEPNGEGDAPNSFTADNHRFIITNQSQPVVAGNWFVTGTNSRIQLGENESELLVFTIPLDFEVSGNIEVNENTVLEIEGIDYPNILSAEPGSTINYKQAFGPIQIPSIAYGNLILENGTKHLLAGNYSIESLSLIGTELTVADDRPTIQLSGDLNLVGNTSFSGNERFSLNAIGANNQNFNFNDILLEVYNFNANKSAGTITLGSGSNVDAVNNFNYNLSGSALLIDGGNTITLGDDLTLAGNESNYELSGVIVMTGANGGTNDLDGGNNSTPPVAVINDLIVNVPAENNLRLRPTGGGETLKIAGNLFILDESVFKFNGNTVEVGGMLNVPANANLLFEGGTLIFNGDGAQMITATASEISLENLVINKANNSIVSAFNTDIFVGDALIFENGYLATDNVIVSNVESVSIVGLNTGLLNGSYTFVIDDNTTPNFTLPFAFSEDTDIIAFRAGLAFDNNQNAPATYQVSRETNISSIEFSPDDIEAIYFAINIEKFDGNDNVENPQVSLSFLQSNLINAVSSLRLVEENNDNQWVLATNVNTVSEDGLVTISGSVSADNGLFALGSILPISVEKITGKIPFTYGPNPTNSNIFFSEPIDFQLYDVSGKLIFDGARKQQIDLSNFQNGIYLLRTLDGSTLKIIKQ
jgi:hypothetical protein